jgi:FlaA1/EpsC-like NDP-sugar epimerase
MIERLAQPFLALPRPAKRLLALSLDACLCALTLWIALSLRFERVITWEPKFLWALAVSVALALPLFVVNGFYRAIFRYTGWHAMKAVGRAIGIYGVLFAAIYTLKGVPGVPRSVGISQPLMLLVTVGASRVLVRYWLGGAYRSLLLGHDTPGVLVYGAGAAGRQLAVGLRNSAEPQRLLGFLDDDATLQGNVINGWPVYPPDQLPQLIRRLKVTDVLLAIPSTTRQRRLEILELLRRHPVHVRTLPGLSDLAAGRVLLSDLHELDIDDLLGRAPVEPNPALLHRDTRGQVVLVTGAGGSIGSELCRQILRCRPTRLLLVERTEYALYQVHQSLQALQAEQAPEVEIVPLLASVGSSHRMGEIMGTWRPDTVYHAAAYKHVPLVEHNPAEGVYNNVWGTLVCAQTAAAAGVRNFVLVSTDKAVRPTNIMGASKRLSELVLQALAASAKVVHGCQGTCFSMVRFGNVLGSSGSVVPLFREQIRRGGPITLTHPDINRFFMTIPEAAQLVIQAGAMAAGGDVFVLDMGQPVRIYDLARRMVELSGQTLRDETHPHGDIAIEITGLRPGEKLYEELLIGDNPQPTTHPRIMKAHEDFLPWPELQPRLEQLQRATQRNDVPAIKAMLLELVHGYQPADGVVDWVHLENERQANDVQLAAEVA